MATRPIFRLTGQIGLISALKAAGGRVDSTAGAALLAEGHRVMDMSYPEVPVDTASLRDSGAVHGPESRGRVTTVTLSYGGNVVNPKTGRVVDYEVPVHERLDVHHPHGKAKFLEDPLKASEAGMADRLARRIKGAIE